MCWGSACAATPSARPCLHPTPGTRCGSAAAADLLLPCCLHGHGTAQQGCSPDNSPVTLTRSPDAMHTIAVGNSWSPTQALGTEVHVAGGALFCALNKKRIALHPPTMDAFCRACLASNTIKRSNARHCSLSAPSSCSDLSLRLGSGWAAARVACVASICGNRNAHRSNFQFS